MDTPLAIQINDLSWFQYPAITWLLIVVPSLITSLLSHKQINHLTKLVNDRLNRLIPSSRLEDLRTVWLSSHVFTSPGRTVVAHLVLHQLIHHMSSLRLCYAYVPSHYLLLVNELSHSIALFYNSTVIVYLILFIYLLYSLCIFNESLVANQL